MGRFLLSAPPPACSPFALLAVCVFSNRYWKLRFLPDFQVRERDNLHRVGESEQLPVNSDEVDYVFANMYLHHVENPGKTIAEMARILKPGGTLVITDLDRHESAFLLTEHHDRWPGFDRADVARWLTAAQLVDINVDSASEECCATSKCGCDNASISIFMASGKKR